MENFDFAKLSDVQIDGIDTKDYPDFVDAYVSYALYDGEEMTDEQLEWLTDTHREYVHEKTFDQLF